HVILDTIAVHQFKPSNITLGESQVRCDIDTPTESISIKTKGRSRSGVDPRDFAENACELDVPPITHEACLPGEIWYIELRLCILDFYSVSINAPVRTCPRPFDGKNQARVII